MTRSLSALLAILLFSTSLLHARLGETLEQCTQRYGKATPTEMHPPFETSDLKWYYFQKNGIAITVGFVKGVAGNILFEHYVQTGNVPSLSGAEIDFLLKANASGHHWQKGNPMNNVEYRRDDGATASTGGGINLVLVSPEWIAAWDAELKAHNDKIAAEQMQNLEGF